jgi:hypothetical protein
MEVPSFPALPPSLLNLCSTLEGWYGICSGFVKGLGRSRGAKSLDENGILRRHRAFRPQRPSLLTFYTP